MEGVKISQNVSSLVDAKKIIDSLSVMNNKYETSKKEAENLVLCLNDSSREIQKANEDTSIARRIGGFSSESLLKLITGSSNATHSSVSAITKLIKNNNDNTKLLAEMIGKLAMLSGLSFEKISETTAELEVLADNLLSNSTGDSEQAGQIKRIILAHINKIKEDKKKSENIEFNFEIINNNLKELNEKLNTVNFNNKIIPIQSLINSENHFYIIQKKQTKIINTLIGFCFFLFLIIMSFLINYYKLLY